MASLCLRLVLVVSLCCLPAASALSTRGAVSQYEELTTKSSVDGSLTGSSALTEPEPEPKPENEPEPEPEPDGEPTSEPDSTEKPELPPFAEPVPDWEDALPLYGAFWVVHIYILGSLFALLAVYSLVSLIRLRTRRLLSRGYFIALNLLMLVMGLDRAVYFFVDAYNYKSIFPLSVAYMLLGMGFPCLSSAFSILFLALLQSTQTRLVSPKIQKVKILAGIIAFHFTVSIVVDVTVGLFTSAQLLLLLCQGVFLIWGLFLSISYLVIFRRLHKSSERQFREINRLSMSRRTSSMYGVSPFMKKPRNNWGSAIKVTLVASFFGVTIGLLQLYGILVVYGPLGEKVPEPWSWACYQLAFRICEMVMCTLMSFVATQPFRYSASGAEKPMFMCCTNCCNKKSHELQENDDYRLVSNGDGSVQWNAFKKDHGQGVRFRPSDSESYQDANLHLPASNTFHKDNHDEPLLILPSTKAPESGISDKSRTPADNTTKNALILNIDPPNSMRNNAGTPASAPILTQQTNPWNNTGSQTLIIGNGLSPEDRKSGNQNKNNHHSCPTTPLHGRHNDASADLSCSNPCLSGVKLLEQEGPLPIEGIQITDNLKVSPDTGCVVAGSSVCNQTEVEDSAVEEAERLDVVPTLSNPEPCNNPPADAHQPGMTDRRSSAASESTDL